MVPTANMDLKNQIQEIALEFPGYGYRRMKAELQNRSYTVNHKRVLGLMRQDNLLCLMKNTKITGLSQAWVSDITYVQFAA